MRFWLNILLVALFNNILISKVSGQDNSPLFYTVDEQDGLVSDLINCIEVDDFGYLWIGSQSGLCRYDGQGFTIMSASGENTTNIVSGNSIADIEQDLEHRIWIATEKGVSFYNLINGEFTYVPKLTTSDNKKHYSYQADKIIISKHGKVYFYSTYNQVHVFRESDSTFVPIFPEFFSKHPIRYAHLDHNDNFWCISEQEHVIYKLTSQGDVLRTIECDKYDIPNPTKGNYTFLDNDNGDIFFGGDNGMVIYDQRTNKFKQLDAVNIDIFPSKEMRCFYKDSRGLIWIGTNAKHLFKYDPATKKLTKIVCSVNHSPYRLNSPTVIDILEDNRGLLWFATWKGLSLTEIHPSKKFHNISSEELEILPARNYISSFDSYDDLIAIGSDGGGVTLWKKGSPAMTDVFDPAERKDTKMQSASTLALCYDKDGYLYTGGYNRGVTRIHPNRKDVDLYKVDPNNPTAMHNDFTVSIMCTPDNKIWVLTNGDGLYELVDKNKGIFKSHKVDKNGKPMVGIYGTTLANYDSKILVGTYLGITVYDTINNTFDNYVCDLEDTTSLSHDWISQIYVDSQKRIWIGTSFGLNEFDINTGKFHQYGRKDGFVSEVIKGILEDKETGNLWVSTSKGISKFSTETRKVLRTYLASDGLLSENFSMRASYCDSEGTMFFGVANGFIYFNPSEIRDDIKLPMPMITGLMINYSKVTPLDNNSPLSKSTEATNKIELDANQSTFTIEFASLNFLNEGGNRYSYCLSGYNENWVDIGTRHEITFTNLDPGYYLFKVKCQNADGSVSAERPLEIIIHPPFYRTWWFIMLYVVFTIGFVILIYYMRTRSIISNQRKLEETVKARTQDLLLANRELESQKEEMMRQSLEISQQRDELVSKNQELELNRVEITKNNQEIRKSFKNILVLNDISRQITSSFDIGNIIITAYNHVTQIVKADFFSVGTYIKSIYSLEFNYIFVEGKPVPKTKISCQELLSAEVGCYNSNTDYLLKGLACEKSFFRDRKGKAFGTMCILPLREGDVANGVFVVGSSVENDYSKTDIANLRMISSYVSIAIDKARDYHQISQKNNAINGSIRYAKTIQDAILVREETINRYFQGMVIFRPKDIVSGDFYWFNQIGSNPDKPEKIFAAVVDCTGHGVPGAFMSLISNTLLNDIIIRSGIYETDQILKQLDIEIVEALNQNNNDNNDGLDMSICRFDFNSEGKIYRAAYSGAKNSLYHYRKGAEAFETLSADRISIGGGHCDFEKKFTSEIIDVNPGDIFVLSSDGILDQNNMLRKRFGRVRFVNTLTQCKDKEMSLIKFTIESELDKFMAGEEQRDDISVMGLRII